MSEGTHQVGRNAGRGGNPKKGQQQDPLVIVLDCDNGTDQVIVVDGSSIVTSGNTQ